MRPTEGVITLYRRSLAYGAATDMSEQEALNAIAQPMSHIGVIKMQTLSPQEFPRGRPVKGHLHLDQREENHTIDELLSGI